MTICNDWWRFATTDEDLQRLTMICNDCWWLATIDDDLQRLRTICNGWRQFETLERRFSTIERWFEKFERWFAMIERWFETFEGWFTMIERWFVTIFPIIIKQIRNDFDKTGIDLREWRMIRNDRGWFATMDGWFVTVLPINLQRLERMLNDLYRLRAIFNDWFATIYNYWGRFSTPGIYMYT